MMNNTASILTQISDTADDLKQEAFLVGGALRNLLIAKEINDIDIIVSENITRFAEQIAVKFDAQPKFIRQSFKDIYRIQLQNCVIDLIELDENIEKDLSKRDLTINSFALPLNRIFSNTVLFERSDIIDLHGGFSDLDAKLVRFTNDQVVNEDPLRMLRAIRIAASFDFILEEHTQNIIIAQKNKIQNIPKERVNIELSSIFQGNRSTRALRLILETGIHEILFSELNNHPIDNENLKISISPTQQISYWLDVFLSKKLPAGEVETQLWEKLWLDTSWIDSNDRLNELQQQKIISKITAAFIDLNIVRFEIFSTEDQNDIDTQLEEQILLAQNICSRWGFSNSISDGVALLIRESNFYLKLLSNKAQLEAIDFFKLHKVFSDSIVAMCWIYLAISSKDSNPEQLLETGNESIENIKQILSWQPKTLLHELSPPFDGNTVMSMTSLEQGPRIQIILDRLTELAAIGELHNHDDAVNMAIELCSNFDEI